MKKPDDLAVAGIAAIMALLGGLSVLADLTIPPAHNLPAWLHVTDADLAWCTLEVQVAVVVIIVCFGSLIMLKTLLGQVGQAIMSGVGLVVTASFFVLVWPTMWLGQRGTFVALPGGQRSLDPVPIPTDFDYRSYLPHLLGALIEPALWSLAGVVPLGVAVAAAVRYFPRLAELER